MTFFQRIATPLAIVGAIALTGCLKSNQTYTIYPDGSGKAEFKMTFLGVMAQMMKSGGMQGMGGDDEGGAPAKKMDPYDALRKSLEGKVYWSNLHTEDGKDGSFTIAGTGYFEDVAQLKMQKGSISFKKNADGGNTFEMTQETPDELKSLTGGGDGTKKTPEQEQQEMQMRGVMQGMMAGFEMKVSVVMPGAVQTAEGMEKGEGRTAVFALTEKDIQAMMDKKKGPPPSKMKVVSSAPGNLDEEMAKFKKELAAAKIEDAKTRAESPKPTEEPKKELTPPPKDGKDGRKGDF